MKTTKIIYILIVGLALISGFKAKAQTADEENKMTLSELDLSTVDKIEYYGEKYICDVITNENTKYKLMLSWVKGWDRFSKLPQSYEKIEFTIDNLDSGVSISDQITKLSYLGYVNNRFPKVSIEKSLYNLSASGYDHNCNRAGCYNVSISAELEIYRVTKLKHFSTHFHGDDYYMKDYSINLDIKDSDCLLQLKDENNTY